MNTPRQPNPHRSPEISTNVAPTAKLSPDEMSAIADASSQHVDYDKHPLRVQGLDHYIDESAHSERFHVW